MKLIYKIILVTLFATMLASCSDDDDKKGDVLQLEATAESLTLDVDKENEVAVSFKWNAGQDRGPQYNIVHYFRLDVFGQNFETSTEPIAIPHGGKLQIDYTHKQLNDLLVKFWGYKPGTEVTLQARVVAKPEAEEEEFMYPEISIVDVKVKGYSAPLYLLGGATIAGLDPEKALRITEEFPNDFYHWKGQLEEGEFKFIEQLGSMLPSINKGDNDNAIVERTSEAQADNMFSIKSAGLYAIALFKSEMKIVTKPIPYPTVYIVGNATSAAWDVEKMIEMDWNPERPNVFTLEIELKVGEIKFHTEKAWASFAFRPLVKNGSIQEETVQVYKGNPDLKWKVLEDEIGFYRITLDTENLKINFDKLK